MRTKIREGERIKGQKEGGSGGVFECLIGRGTTKGAAITCKGELAGATILRSCVACARRRDPRFENESGLTTGCQGMNQT